MEKLLHGKVHFVCANWSVNMGSELLEEDKNECSSGGC